MAAWWWQIGAGTCLVSICLLLSVAPPGYWIVDSLLWLVFRLLRGFFPEWSLK
ncbi:uncharacterized protein THITE_2108044 [Thermothielavioides terrestris NRRL 8126]|uniref:Uncharacterized protein n=1 Tax=Thermothielavioides terrestris (strain ATCC 38088 / NRRL 8126) TaxID=578455 RepID=G2QXC4_THETT|nr:uncharacterized protein THITE_2108044 [Thermothielavioides terrestris NRRL 8126]AEO63147.1 hypothetical protein THITE_2108044 [Thermothielavioides terrestris NRRL 8126]